MLEPPFARLLLVSLPSGVTARQLDYAVVLGTREALAARIADILPGAAFDDQGSGTFRLSGYEIGLTIADPDPTRIDAILDRPEALVALKRLVDKTGWQIVDEAAGVVVDADASRAAGLIVPLVPRPAATASTERSASRIRLSHAFAMILLVAGLWAGWEWSRRVPGIPRRPLPPSVAGVVAAVSAARASATPQASGGSSVATAVMQELAQAGASTRARMRAVKLLAPEFRNDPIVRQLLEYRIAADTMPSLFNEDGVMPPERLSDASLFAQLHVAAPLPPTFAAATRDGYAFRFDGRNCSHRPKHFPQLGDLCADAVYSAQPLDPAKGAKSFAYFTADDRIHYRADGALPTPNDPTVDNMAPSTAADLPGAAPPEAKTDSRITAAWNTAMNSMAKAAGFGNAAEATVAFHEQNALADLKQLSDAEHIFFAMTAMGFASPARLADASSFAGSGMRPLLPAYYGQPLRQGYKYEFFGANPNAPPAGPFAAFGQLYGTYVYVAIPQDPGPVGRRAFALYPDAIFATTERRTPTRTDTPIGLR